MVSLVLATLLLAAAPVPPSAAPSLPNIVIILADDLGYGDPRVQNAESRIPTPNIDRLAREGMRFTDAHSPSAVCSPTRYGLLTGRYAWRTSLKQGVLWGHSPCLLQPDRQTIASMLKDRGYATACVGKWHLGFGDAERTDYAVPLRPGPRTVGFDSFEGIPASLDIPPYVWVIDDRVEELPSATVKGSAHRRKEGGGFWREGDAGPSFRHDAILPRIGQVSARFIRQQHPGTGPPFFLYVPLTAPHTPWLPGEEYRGSSEAGHYGDFVAHVDAVLGEILAAIEDTGQSENTLVVFTSDNGSHWPTSDTERWNHAANGDLRGQKADIHEGGHRVPMLVRWPGRVQPGTVSDETVCLVDWFATCRSIAGADEAAEAGEDSFDLLPILQGDVLDAPLRASTIHHAVDGMFAIRSGRWKYIEGRGSGGFTPPRRIEPVDGEPAGQLYDLVADPSESTNVYLDHPDVVARLQSQLDLSRTMGRTAPVLDVSGD
ncbi:MAG: arylsulfatase [Planctomycetota bacterium]|nr:arylsulfatase [Planctomycetota bacterium]